ncbi:MAG: hypothetical protein GF408_03845 [Candidatus Omnitrophica bacterium]|nr:hypothetical protein [Candidatus Omnitrophota bacterium]
MFGAIMGVLSILFHSFVDFNLHMPANALYFTVLCAIISGISSSGRQGKLSDIRGQTSAKYISVISNNLRNPQLNYAFLNKLINAIIIAGFTVGLFGIIQWLGWNGRMFWIVDKPGKNFGPYVCYNHFAGLMEMTGFFAIAMFYSGLFLSPLRHIKRLKDKIVWFSSEQANKTLIYLFLSVVIAGALFLSSSKGGILSFGLALIVFMLVIINISVKGRQNKMKLSALAVFTLFVIMILWLGPENTLQRFRRFIHAVQYMYSGGKHRLLLRPYIWVDTVRMILRFPATGTGLGTYSDMFMPFRRFPAIWGFLRYAHQDYLHLFAELGLAGAAFLAGFLVWHFRRFRECVRRLRRGAENLEK